MLATCSDIDELGRMSPMTNHVARSSKSMSHKCIPKLDLHQIPSTLCSTQPLVPNLDFVLNNLHFGTKGAMTMHALFKSHIFHSHGGSFKFAKIYPSVPKLLSKSQFFSSHLYCLVVIRPCLDARVRGSNAVKEKALSSQLLLTHVGKFVIVSAAAFHDLDKALLQRQEHIL